MRNEVGKSVIVIICGSLVYYHCAFRNSSLLSLLSDVLIVLLCSLAILGLLFRQLNISVPVDPLEWQISQDSANSIAACLANTIGAAESVLRVAATGHDKRLFLKVVVCLYILSAVGRLLSGVTVAYAGNTLFPFGATLGIGSPMYFLKASKLLSSGYQSERCYEYGLCLFCLYMLVENFQSSNSRILRLCRVNTAAEQENL